MSLRKQAKILGIAPSYLSMLINGKRRWPHALRERYEELVNSFVNTLGNSFVNRSVNTFKNTSLSILNRAGDRSGARKPTEECENGF